jgi:hypothetical protein
MWYNPGVVGKYPWSNTELWLPFKEQDMKSHDWISPKDVEFNEFFAK